MMMIRLMIGKKKYTRKKENTFDCLHINLFKFIFCHVLDVYTNFATRITKYVITTEWREKKYRVTWLLADDKIIEFNDYFCGSSWGTIFFLRFFLSSQQKKTQQINNDFLIDFFSCLLSHTFYWFCIENSQTNQRLFVIILTCFNPTSILNAKKN